MTQTPEPRTTSEQRYLVFCFLDSRGEVSAVGEVFGTGGIVGRGIAHVPLTAEDRARAEQKELARVRRAVRQISEGRQSWLYEPVAGHLLVDGTPTDVRGMAVEMVDA